MDLKCAIDYVNQHSENMAYMEDLGGSIRQAMCDDDCSDYKLMAYILYMFNKHPDQAELLNEMLVALIGWSFQTLVEHVNESFPFPESLEADEEEC